jgi:hypothetical protein
LSSSGLEKNNLGLIWRLCDRPIESGTTGKGFLKKNEWIVCLHLIFYGKKGFPIPQVLTKEIEEFLLDYSDANMVQEQAFSSNTNTNPNNFMSNRDSISVQQSNQYQTQQPVPAQRETLGLQNPYSGNILPKEYTQAAPENNSRNVQAPVRSEPLDFASAFKKIDLSPDDVINLLEEMVQSNSTNAQKYNDETDNFNSELKKINAEKDLALKALFQELSELRSLTADNIDLRKALANESKDIIQRSVQNDNLLGMKEFLTNLENPLMMNEAEQLMTIFGVVEPALPAQRNNHFVQAEQAPKQAQASKDGVESSDFFNENLPPIIGTGNPGLNENPEDDFFNDQ